MKTKKTISKLVASAVFAAVSIVPSFAQSNLGSACGCPPVASRPTKLMSAMPGFVTVPNANGGELTNGATLSCDTTYIMDRKIYIPSGKTISINPGTVIKGRVAPLVAGVPDPAQAAALIIERGGKINANGAPDCQIVFTAEADAVNGLYSISNKGMWGGVVILGRATNNLTLAANGPFVAGGAGKLAVADGLGVLEGFATSVPQDRYGVNLSATPIVGEAVSESFNDNDNSGVMKYVSIRHAGAILAVGAEINGLTLGSVGRATTIEHIEIVSCADDNIEIFGGTVNFKYVTGLFGNDDMIDYDLGWTGKAQFLFGMKTDVTASADSDNGFEMDSDDNKSNNLPKSHPVFYNVTLMGNTKATGTSDNSALAAINAKEITEGEIYNSIFANFRNGFNTAKSLGTRTGTSEAYHNWAVVGGNGSQSLKVKCNTFVGTTNPLTNGASSAAAGTAGSTDDMTQFTTTDKNVIVAGNTLPGFDYNFTVNNTTNAFTVKNDVVPFPALTTTGCPIPVDPFFDVVNYRGAFKTGADNWLSDWSYSSILGTTRAVTTCPTDVNGDGVTNGVDLVQLIGSYNFSCDKQ